MCCFSLKNSLSQVFALLQRYFCRRHCFYASLSFSPSKQNLNSSGLCLYSKKFLKMGHLKCPWGKFETGTLIFTNLPVCNEPIHIFFKNWDASAVFQAGFGPDLCPFGIQCSWPNRKDEIQEPGPLLCWERANKKQLSSAFRPGYHCVDEFHYFYSDSTCNWSAVFMLAADMFILLSQSCILCFAS